MERRPPTYSLGPDFRHKLVRFRNRIIEEGFAEFAGEFANLDDFICRAWAEESSENRLRRTPKNKYLMELLAFSVYDEINREAFNKTADTLIILPDCLSLDNPDCEKVDGKYGDMCQQCLPDCGAYRVMELAERYHAEVAFSKRKLSEQLEHYADKLADVGVIGIACVIMLAEGMRTAADVGVPARGVLLSFSGCEHWNDQPFASQFAMEWLEEILREKYGS
jgi:hypothetical protein